MAESIHGDYDLFSSFPTPFAASTPAIARFSMGTTILTPCTDKCHLSQ
jgi:hypothetical protein